MLFGAEFLLFYQGLVWTTASRAVVFLYTAPLFVAIGARWAVPGDRFRPIQWTGLVLCFAGIAAAFGVPSGSADPRQTAGDLLMLIAAASWGATTLVIKASALNRSPSEKTLLYQLLVSIPLLVLGVLASGERVTEAPSAVALGALAYQTILVTGISYVAWFALVQRYSASRLAAFTFLTPLFGVVAGHLVLDEPVTASFATAVLMVIGGLVLVNRPPK